MIANSRSSRRLGIFGAAVVLVVGMSSACSRDVAESPPAATPIAAESPPEVTPIAVATIGAVSAWGDNHYSQLGDGTQCDKPKPGDNCVQLAPVPVVGTSGTGQLSNLLSISTGAFHTLALQPGRNVLSWGLNEEGQLGTGTFGGNSPVPVSVVGPGGTGRLDKVTAVAAGGHSLALREGQAWAWGSNLWGQVGVGTAVGPQYCPPTGRGPARSKRFAAPAGTKRSAVDPQADPSTSCSQFPRAVLGSGGQGQLSNVKAIAGGENHSVALLQDGTVWTWGLNDLGQLGTGKSSGPEKCKPFSHLEAAGCSTKPVQVVGPGGVGYLGNVVALAAGTEFTLALRSDGSVWAWGSNAFNTLGQVDPRKLEQCPTPFSPPVYCSTKPLQVVGPKGQGFLTGMTAVSAEASPAGLHAMALHMSGSVWSWGVNDMGQLGNGKSEEYQAAPVQVVGPNGQGFLTKVGAIDVGGKFSVALRTDGTVWAWGINNSGQLGQNSGTGPQSCTTEGDPCSLTPVQVKGPRGQGLLTDVAAVAAGDSNVVAGVRP